ncbi:MAG: hypothetical protein C4548_13080 [Desulfobacteraceae bacterium]|jgi:hypothetical protein|nr:MAG: hypothetical protein C4548_13080 [Desulfobacteraceae bacterium]
MNPSIYVVIDIISVSAIFDIRTCPFGVVAAPVFELASSCFEYVVRNYHMPIKNRRKRFLCLRPAIRFRSFQTGL